MQLARAFTLLLALSWPAAAEDPHWAFRPVSLSTVSEAHEGTTNPIDHFIESRLHANQLTPAPTASKRILIRRLYFNLLGLPPTPEEVAAYVNNEVTF